MDPLVDRASSIMYIVYMKRFSVAETRSKLPTLLRKVEQEPIVISRHGVPAAVLLSTKDFEMLQQREGRVWTELLKWRETVHDLSEHEGDGVFDGVRSNSPDGGRSFSWD